MVLGKKQEPKWFVKGVSIFIHRTRLTCINACNTNKTTLFFVICDFVSLQC